MDLTIGNTYSWHYQPTFSDGPYAPAKGELVKVTLLELAPESAPAKGYARVQVPSGRAMLVPASDLGLWITVEVDLPLGPGPRVSNSCEHG